MRETNQVSLKLLQEGWTKDQTPPGMKPWNDFYGGWTYAPDARRNVVFASPCGLLWQRAEVSYSGTMYYMGVDWTEENDCIAALCPHYDRTEPCEVNHPLLEEHACGGCHYENLHFCALHETDASYTYEKSAKRVIDEAEHRAEEQWAAFSEARGGRVCRTQSCYNRRTGEWSMTYDPMRCTQMGCRFCSVLNKDLSDKRGNVFYDVTTRWTVHGAGLYPDEQKSSVTKGVKWLKRPSSLTICEAIVKACREDIAKREKMRRHVDLFLGRIDSVEVSNIRAEIKAGRDLEQDLKDLAAGMEVHHQADDLAAAKAAEKAKRSETFEKHRREQEKKIRKRGWDSLDSFEKRKARKYLEPEEIEQIEAVYKEEARLAAAGIGENYSLF